MCFGVPNDEDIDRVYSKELDRGVFHYYHPELKRSGIVYVNERRIELLEKNRLVERLDVSHADYTETLDTVRRWVFKT